jgi:hypothetical protein
MSGHSYSDLSTNGKDFQEIDYSENNSYSGEAKLMTSTWAEAYGSIDGDSGSGTNFRHGDLVVFKISRQSGSSPSPIPVALLGATLRYTRDRV